MSRGSESYHVCLFNNRLREIIEDSRADGKITRETEVSFLEQVSAVLSTLKYKNPKWRREYNEMMEMYGEKLIDESSDTPFDLKEFAGTLNAFIGKVLWKIEERRIKIKGIKNNNRLTNRALDRLSIRLNEDVASLLITSDVLNEIINCEDESELEFLLMTSSEQV